MPISLLFPHAVSPSSFLRDLSRNPQPDTNHFFSFSAEILAAAMDSCQKHAGMTM